MFEQMSSRFKSDATSLLTDNTFKYPGKHRCMNRFNIISNLAEISCRDETTESIVIAVVKLEYCRDMKLPELLFKLQRKAIAELLCS